MEDTIFLDHLDIEAKDHDLALAIRRVFAKWCNLPAEEILPDTPPLIFHSRMKLGWDRGWDNVGFGMQLEEETQLYFNDELLVLLPTFLGWYFFFWKHPGPKTLSEWISKAIPVINQCVIERS